MKKAIPYFLVFGCHLVFVLRSMPVHYIYDGLSASATSLSSDESSSVFASPAAVMSQHDKASSSGHSNADNQTDNAAADNTDNDHDDNAIVDDDPSSHHRQALAQYAQAALQRMKERNAAPFPRQYHWTPTPTLLQQIQQSIATTTTTTTTTRHDNHNNYDKSSNDLSSNSYTLSDMELGDIARRAFPLTWKPCALRPQQKVVATLLGASCSAWAGLACRATTRNPLEGRYSNQLEYWLARDGGVGVENNMTTNDDNYNKNTTGSRSAFVNFRIQNMAQGATTSEFNALLLDQLLGPRQNYDNSISNSNNNNTTELLIWEFGLNDMARTPKKEQVRKLEFWLRRIHAHYTNTDTNTNGQQQPQRKPPPIVLLFFWKYEQGKEMKKHANHVMASYNATTLHEYAQTQQQQQQRQTLHNNNASVSTPAWTISANPLHRVGPILQSYRDLGWDIGVVDVGAIVNVTQVMLLTAATSMTTTSSNIQNQNNPHSTTTTTDSNKPTLEHPLVDFPFHIFGDSSHPSCVGNELLADLLEYFVYSNMAECGVDETQRQQQEASTAAGAATTTTTTEEYHHNNGIGVPPIKKVLIPDLIDNKWKELWTDLFNATTKIGALSPWLPNAASAAASTATAASIRTSNSSSSSFQSMSPYLSNLNIVNRASVQKWPMILNLEKNKGVPLPNTREDRKHAYAIPGCTRKSAAGGGGAARQSLRLELDEPNLKWLGLSLFEAPGEVAPLVASINEHPLNSSLIERDDKWTFIRTKQKWINRWINLRRTLNERIKTDDVGAPVVIQLCHNAKSAKPLPLYHIVGAVVPHT